MTALRHKLPLYLRRGNARSFGKRLKRTCQTAGVPIPNGQVDKAIGSLDAIASDMKTAVLLPRIEPRSS